jgi:MoxR-like ATPase
LDYPTYAQEVEIVKSTTSSSAAKIGKVLDKSDILTFQGIVKKVPIADNVVEYAVSLTQKTRPGSSNAPEISSNYLEWGAGPRGSQFLVTAAKCNALLNGKFSPDIEDVQAIAKPTLRHRMFRNFKAEAESISVDYIIDQLM